MKTFAVDMTCSLLPPNMCRISSTFPSSPVYVTFLFSIPFAHINLCSHPPLIYPLLSFPLLSSPFLSSPCFLSLQALRGTRGKTLRNGIAVTSNLTQALSESNLTSP